MKPSEFKDQVRNYIKLNEECAKKKDKKLFSVNAKSETFKCPDCGSKVLKKTGYCVKCKKKIEEGCSPDKKKKFLTNYNADGGAETGGDGGKEGKILASVNIEAKTETGRKIRSSEDAKRKDKPSYMPSGKNRLTNLEGKHGETKKPESPETETDAELFADAVCKKRNLPTIGGKWEYFKSLYLKVWNGENPDSKLKNLRNKYT